MAEYITPIIIFLIVFAALSKKAPLYSLLTDGAEEGLKIVTGILPTLIMMLTAVSMFEESGALDFLISLLAPITKAFNIPKGAMPMILLRPVSGSGAFGVLSDIFSKLGPDSKAGMLSSVIMASTETTFYTLAVYFGATSVKNAKRAIPCAVIGDIAGVITALLIIN